MAWIRALLFSAYFWTVSAAMTIGYLPVLFFGRRETVVTGMRRWAWLVMRGLRAIARIRIEVRGRGHIPEGAALIAMKHQSMWETVMVHLLFRDPAVVMKRILLFVPLYGAYARKAQMITVNREGHARALRRLIADSRAALKAGRQVVIFPEGTRKPPRAPPDYKPGIAALYQTLGVPCIPVALNSGLTWPRRGLVRGPGTIVVEVLPAIGPGLERHAFMAALQNRIERATARLCDESRKV